MATDDDLRQLFVALTPFLSEAIERGKSMVTLELDPTKLLGLASSAQDPRLVVALALGPSVGVLRQAIEMAQNPH